MAGALVPWDWIAFAATLALVVVVFLLRERRREIGARAAVAEARELGTHIPVSLHPLIDTDLCIGSAACAMACPEQTVLAIVAGRAQLAHAAECIGHGACQAACPVDAIRLVFGSEARGVDIPYVSATFETNVRGMYVAGELGGMGLVRNAVRQGEEAAEYIAADLGAGTANLPDDHVDVAVVGAGPAGVAAAVRAHQLGLCVALLDQERFGGAILQYPRHKVVITRPFTLPGVGNVGRGTLHKEQLLELLARALTSAAITPREFFVHEIAGAADGFALRAAAGDTPIGARRVLLAMGRRGHPRRLNIPGEDLPFVTFRMLDAWQYRDRDVLVVGGGDSAVEACLALAEDGARPTLCYRQERVTRAKRVNRDGLDAALRQGRVRARFQTRPLSIGADGTVHLQSNDGEARERFDFVLIQAGGEPPRAFLERAGVRVDTRRGQTGPAG